MAETSWCCNDEEEEKKRKSCKSQLSVVDRPMESVYTRSLLRIAAMSDSHLLYLNWLRLTSVLPPSGVPLGCKGKSLFSIVGWMSEYSLLFWFVNRSIHGISIPQDYFQGYCFDWWSFIWIGLEGLQYFPLQVYPWIARVNPYSVLWAECPSILFFSYFLFVNWSIHGISIPGILLWLMVIYLNWFGQTWVLLPLGDPHGCKDEVEVS